MEPLFAYSPCNLRPGWALYELLRLSSRAAYLAGPNMQAHFPAFAVDWSKEPMRDPTIVVVDDEPQIRRVLRATLATHGYVILEAANGNDAVQAVMLEHPDLVLLDMNMPDMDGLETCGKLRATFSGPIIMATVRDSERDKITAFDCGADDYVVKPFAMEELLARIRAALRRCPAGVPLKVATRELAFAPTPAGAGRLGNCGVGILEGPGTIAVSAGLGKTFVLTERLKLRFESTSTNVLNHTNYAAPAVNISNPQTFGVLESGQTSANTGPRTGQFALRLLIFDALDAASKCLARDPFYRVVPVVSTCTGSSGYASMPNSGMSRPSSSTSRGTRIDFTAFTPLKTTYVKTNA
jgi:DNA-binding response OmpR family regulator